MERFAPRRLLVATDRTPRSAFALRYARRWAERLGAAVETIHVADGDPAAGILSAARERRADLVVVGTEGRTGLRRLARPSVAEAVARGSAVPVLVVPRGAPEPRSVLVPVNLRAYGGRGQRLAEGVAKALGAELVLLHVHGGGSATRSLKGLEAASREAQRGFPLALRVREGDPVDAILGESSVHGLVVLVEHAGGWLRDAWLGTTAEQVLRRSTVPVLVVPARPARGR
jgi:nucleotide-binding universal stress UspA family protein